MRKAARRVLENWRRKREAKRRGKKPIDGETLDRMKEGVMRQGNIHILKRVMKGSASIGEMFDSMKNQRERLDNANRRHVVKKTLDRMGVVDREKRQRIHDIDAGMANRMQFLEAWKKDPKKDMELTRLKSLLVGELGSKRKANKYMRERNKLLRGVMGMESEEIS
jgi:hypothetical protein